MRKYSITKSLGRLTGCLLLTAPLLSTTALASDFYLTVGVGQAYSSDSDATIILGGGEEAFTTNFDNAPIAKIGIGYEVLDYLDLEFVYQHNFSSQSVSDADRFTSSTGTDYYQYDIETESVMLNAALNLADLAEKFAGIEKNYYVEPYVGFGFGAARNTIDDAYRQNGAGAFSRLQYQRHKETGFAKRLFAGLQIPFSDKLTFDLSYSYSDYGRAKTSNTYNWISTSGEGNEVQGIHFDHKTHEIGASVRYNF
ncbi:exported hypothetical protein [Candidatus Terasakiella magnetica]|uniref:Outer membrane protein beta-barrel domain-containing protein n=1 Tax=Candidatus Terasakiella magnetica TaxID=1867952 RepID=A0A1C3RLI6_9PROT|nr:outer membrane beta-barrel protein [Candidatus Terasakiella magnetica]SCA58059.1 exported hypothetical protein [Candidatus Terasakiella magnetica]